ncbi:unnamed protein product [Effrenium voratum]|nr:unnamed protein product [Effrenium voratum]
MAFETETVELEAEVEAAWLLVPALLAGVAATVAMGGIMAFCRRRGEFEALASPAGDKRITVQVVPVASRDSLASTVSEGD